MYTFQNRTRNMVQVSLFAILISICAWIVIPTVIPFTLQTFAIFLCVCVLGGKKGTAAICIYLLLGSIGIPVFSGGQAGIGVLLGNTGGYLIGFVFLGLIVWGMENVFGRKPWVLTASMFLGLIVCYFFGTVWFYSIYTGQSGAISLWTIFGWCVLPFVIPDLLKLFLALLIYKRLVKIICFA